jgi:hypothetical protein
MGSILPQIPHGIIFFYFDILFLCNFNLKIFLGNLGIVNSYSKHHPYNMY